MLNDYAIPNNNETEFIEIASKLGIKKLYFLYNFDLYDEEKAQSIVKNSPNISIETGFIVNANNLSKAYKKSKILAAKSSDKDRFFIESRKISIIYGLEAASAKDYLHQRASGLNHIICGLASKNSVNLGFSYSQLLGKNNQLAPLFIGRLIQNINLCRKYKVKTVIGAFSRNPLELRQPHDVMALFRILGFSGNNQVL